MCWLRLSIMMSPCTASCCNIQRQSSVHPVSFSDTHFCFACVSLSLVSLPCWGWSVPDMRGELIAVPLHIRECSRQFLLLTHNVLSAKISERQALNFTTEPHCSSWNMFSDFCNCKVGPFFLCMKDFTVCDTWKGKRGRVLIQVLWSNLCYYFKWKNLFFIPI